MINKLKAKGTSGMQNFIIILAAIALFAVFTVINPGFASSGNLLTMTKSLVPYAILSLGVTFAIATGGIDLSLGTVCFGSAVLAGALCKTGVTAEEGTLWLTIPIILVVGVIFGLINGFLVAKCKIAPFIATLGTMLVSRGLTAVVAEASRGTSSAVKYPSTGWFQKIFTNLNGFPIGIVWVLVLTVICMIVMYKTKIGRYILAIGSNEEAARLSGINTANWKIGAYVLSGFFVGMAALFYAAVYSTITPGTGAGQEMHGITGVIVGGTSMAGGSGTMVGTLIGVFIMSVLKNGLPACGLQAPWQNFFTGIVVIGAVLLDIQRTKAAAKVKKA